MKNVSGMHKTHAITNLAHEHYRCFFCQNKIIVDNSLEQLPTCNSKKDINQTHLYISTVVADQLVKFVFYEYRFFWNVNDEAKYMVLNV